jgi:hypothetical protein
MKLLPFALAILACAVVLAQYAEVTPRLDPDTVFLNPHMGLYVMGGPDYRPAPSEWFMQAVDIAYIRDDWAKLNPAEGVYKFDEYFGPIFDYWVKQCGKRVAFRFMSESMHSNTMYVSPKWIFDKGVPGVHHTGLYTPDQIDPVFWDDRYLDIQCAFIRKLGEYLDGRPGLEFIDIGCIGEWGEMHLARWTPKQLEETGFTETKYAQAYRRVIDAFAAAFPRTRVFLNVGGQDHLTIDDYAAIHGIGFRQDGLMPEGASYNCGEWLYKPYSRRSTVCQFEFCDDYASMVKKGWDLPATIDRGLAAPISYLNCNLCDLSTAPPIVREQLLRAGRKLGYRFVVTKVKYRDQFHLDGQHPARIFAETTWRNDGVAPCYDSFATEWSLVDAGGKAVVRQVTFPQTPTTRWWPGEEQTVSALIHVPADTPPGDYRLKVAVVLPETGKRIFLGIKAVDAERRYSLCTLHGVATPATSGVVFDEGFEANPAPWTVSQGITATVDTVAAHTGKASLLVVGTMGAAWNYTSFRLPKPLVPGAKYRLSGWMRVDKLEGIGAAPYLKIGVNAADGHWIDNHSTNPYDLGKLGTWQPLEGTFECPADGATGDLCIEKGQFEGNATISLRLDDVKLEMLESP